MVLKKMLVAIVVGVTYLAWNGFAVAGEYRPEEFLGLDLSKAVLSPKPLGPPAQFAPVRVEAKADRSNEARPVRVERIRNPEVHLAPLDRERHRVVARTRLARGHRHPLDAQAFDARIQAWPCKSGGICNWKPQAN
jgi:hypothetical protein